MLKPTGQTDSQNIHHKDGHDRQHQIEIAALPSVNANGVTTAPAVRSNQPGQAANEWGQTMYRSHHPTTDHEPMAEKFAIPKGCFSGFCADHVGIITPDCFYMKGGPSLEWDIRPHRGGSRRHRAHLQLYTRSKCNPVLCDDDGRIPVPAPASHKPRE